jgi:hypothetical protein
VRVPPDDRRYDLRIMPLTAAQLVDMSPAELDDLFRGSPAGPIPAGKGAGTALFAPGTALGKVAATVVRAVAWKGKVFDPDRGELLNLISPAGALAIRAKVFPEESWFDGKESIILDYRNTSRVARWIRDEIRMIDTGTYLGIVYWGHTKILRFALQFQPA